MIVWPVEVETETSGAAPGATAVTVPETPKLNGFSLASLVEKENWPDLEPTPDVVSMAITSVSVSPGSRWSGMPSSAARAFFPTSG